MRLVIILLLATISVSLSGQNDIFGQWKTIDDESGEEKSIVEIYSKDGVVYGKILKLLNPEPGDPDPICDECSDHRKDQKIIGMEIISNLQQDEDEWSGGEILDPENGKVYRCKIWVEDGALKVRGYIAFLYRTQTWYPAG